MRPRSPRSPSLCRPRGVRGRSPLRASGRLRGAEAFLRVQRSSKGARSRPGSVRRLGFPSRAERWARGLRPGLPSDRNAPDSRHVTQPVTGAADTCRRTSAAARALRLNLLSQQGPQLLSGSVRHEHTSKSRGARDSRGRRLGLASTVKIPDSGLHWENASAATESVQKLTGVCGGCRGEGVGAGSGLELLGGASCSPSGASQALS